MTGYSHSERIYLELAVHFLANNWEAFDGTRWVLPPTKLPRRVHALVDAPPVVEEVWALHTYLAWPYDEKGVVRGLL